MRVLATSPNKKRPPTMVKDVLSGLFQYNYV